MTGESHRYTALPDNVDGHRGERRVARTLDDMRDEQLHFWCALDFIPGINDIDLLLVHEQVGAFVVEIKAVSLDAVRLYELDYCRLEGRDSTKTPLRQAKIARDQLAAYLRDPMPHPPFLVATACWPEITRPDWISRWTSPGLLRQAEGMIFRDDLRESAALIERLQVIASRPGIGTPSKGIARFNLIDLDGLDKTLRGRPVQRTKTDIMRLRAIEKGIAEQQRSEFSSGTNHRVIFRGYPGTGKTFRLLDIGLHDAITGKDVLYICYNKVLASDLVRLVQMAGHSARIAGSIDCRHVFQVVNEKHSDGYGKGGSSSQPYDIWAASVVNDYTRNSRAKRGPYSTILVDEAQDLQDWAFPLIETEAAPDANIFVADGPGQALYRPDEPSWLSSFRARAQVKQLRRNFRNTTFEFLVAQCFFETAPDHEAATRFLSDRSTSVHEQGQLQIELDFEHGAGTPHSVVRVDTSSADRFDDEDPLRATELRAAMVPALRREVSQALKAIEPAGQPSDILILVPSRGSNSAEWARLALSELARVDHVSYIDYTKQDQRETPARPEEIRLCTFHSSRGIEARRVIVVNFQEITWLTAPLRHIGYIVLSRATERTTIVVPSGARSDALDFLERVVARVGRGDNTR